MAAALATEARHLAMIYIDLETAGLRRDAEILQLAARGKGRMFNVYVNPVGRIPRIVSEVNGLTTYRNRLLYRGRPVKSVPIRTALLLFIEWMRSLEVECCLVAHNLEFDGPKLWTEIQRHFLNAEFAEVVACFVDTLPLMRTVTKRGFRSYALEALANQFDIQYEAHTALEDCRALGQVLRAMEITDEILLEHSNPFAQQTDHWDRLKRIQRIRSTLNPLNGAVTPGIIKKIAVAEISFEILTEVYLNGGENGLMTLFAAAGLRFRTASFNSIRDFFVAQVV